MEVQNIPTISLKGKEYTEVKDRVMFFRGTDTYKGWYFITEPLQVDANIAYFVCKVYNDENTLVSTGTAYEQAGQGMVNKTNHVENAETSAVGRALGFLGIGIVGGIAPAENVKNISEEWINNKQRSELAKMIQDSETDLAKFCDSFVIGKLSELPVSQYEKAKAMLQSKLNKIKKNENSTNQN